MDVSLDAQVRSQSGKGAARRLRQEQKVPAVLYGPKTEAVSLSVSSKKLEKLLRDIGEESKLLDLSYESAEGVQTKQVLIREIQTHPVRRQFLHIDFYEVPLDRQIMIEVPVELRGEAVGVKKGGTLNLIRRVLPVKCLPGQIPERVYVDVSAMDLGDAFRVSDLPKQDAYEVVEDKNVTIANMLSPEGATSEGE